MSKIIAIKRKIHSENDQMVEQLNLVSLDTLPQHFNVVLFLVISLRTLIRQEFGGS